MQNNDRTLTHAHTYTHTLTPVVQLYFRSR